MSVSSLKGDSRRTDRHDPQTPNVDLGAVLFASDDLGSHPVGRTDHGSPLGVGWIRDLGTEAKVGCKASSQHIIAITGSKERRGVCDPA